MDFIGETEVFDAARETRELPHAVLCSRRKANMEEMYEVLRFIEHGAHCRQSMDCIHGMPLIRYLRENPRLEKTVFFNWVRRLGVCVDQYHRSRSRQEYCYLNPYSIIVSEEGDLMLLDLEAPGNAFVIKQMQKRAVRSHFVKPVCEMGPEKNRKADVFAYGKTIQFILAYAEISPEMTRREEIRFSRIISRCVGESGRRYEDITQVFKEIPVLKDRRKILLGKRGKRLAAGACACVGLCTALIPVRSMFSEQSLQTVGENSLDNQASEIETVSAEQREMTEEDLQKTVDIIRKIELAAVRTLAGAYKKLDMQEEAAAAYGRLVEIEDAPTKIEEAGINQMMTEAELGDYKQAAETGEKVLDKIKHSEKISGLIKEYESGKTSENKKTLEREDAG